MVTNAQLIRIWNLERVEPIVVRQNEQTESGGFARVSEEPRLSTTITLEVGAPRCRHVPPATYSQRINKPMITDRAGM